MADCCRQPSGDGKARFEKIGWPRRLKPVIKVQWLEIDTKSRFYCPLEVEGIAGFQEAVSFYVLILSYHSAIYYQGC